MVEVADCTHLGSLVSYQLAVVLYLVGLVTLIAFVVLVLVTLDDHPFLET